MGVVVPKRAEAESSQVIEWLGEGATGRHLTIWLLSVNVPMAEFY